MTTDEMRRVAQHLEQRQAEYYDTSWWSHDKVESDAAYAWFVLTHERWGRALERLTARTRTVA